MIKGVLFDLDETLLDRTGSLKAFLFEQHARHPELSETSSDKYVGRFIELDRRGQTKKSAVYPQLLSELLIRSDNLAAKLVGEYIHDFSQFARGFKELNHLFHCLQEMHLCIGIVTNGRTDFQMRTIRALGIERYVKTILISEAEGIRKPEKRIFLRAAAQLGLAPAECLFVGDNPIADILGAHSVGMSTIWFPNGAEWPSEAEANPGFTIHNLGDVLDALNRLG